MSYPVISRRAAQDLADQLEELRKDGGDILSRLVDEEAAGVILREGSDYDRSAVEARARELRAEFAGGLTTAELEEKFKARDAASALEAAMAGPIHAQLSKLDITTLQDDGFWRYLALFPFRWYLVARKPKLKPVDFGGLKSRGDDEYSSPNMRSQLIRTTYVWGACAFDEAAGGAEGHYARATALDQKQLSIVDFWHSHMIRVKVGHMGEVPKALVDVTKERGLTTDEARKLQKLLTRIKNTVLFEVYNYDGARELVEEQADLLKVIDIDDSDDVEYTG